MNSLVDDIWLMSDEKAEVEKGMKEIVELMDHMGIRVHKWGANCSDLLRDIPEEKRAKRVQGVG